MSSGPPPTNAELSAILNQLASYTDSITGTSNARPSQAQGGVPAPGARSIGSNSGYQSYSQATQRSDSSSATRPAPTYASKAAASLVEEKTVDPSTITEFPAALRYVSKYIVRNPRFEQSVREMIKEQRKHEKEWWESRKQFLLEQEAKAESSAQIEKILRGVNGITVNPMVATSQQRQEALAVFDRKIHNAASQMNSQFMLNLARFKVPFFILRKDLVHVDPDSAPPKGSVTSDELRQLRKKMIAFLEDMYGDDQDE